MFAKLVKTNEPLLVLKHEEETNFWISQLTNKKHPSLMYGFNEIFYITGCRSFTFNNDKDEVYLMIQDGTTNEQLS